MKKLLLSVAAAALAASVCAEGYQVNNLSSRQNGMGHVGTAMKLGSESLWFNPAAAVCQNSKFDISFGVTGIISKGTYVSLPDYTGKTQPSKFLSDNKMSTPLYVYANYKPTEWMSVGVAFNTPFGSTMKWGDDWAGAHLCQEINLAAYNVQPTLSFKIAKGLYVGGGLMLAWGNFDLSKSLLPVGAQTNAMLDALAGALDPTLAGAGIFASAGDRSIASISLKGDADLAVGANVGIMWDAHEQWTFGFTYRSQLNMKVDSGDVALNVIDDPRIAGVVNAMLPSIGLDPSLLAKARIKTELPLPATLTWGVSFRPVQKWEFSVDLQYVLWSAYENLRVDLVLPDGSTRLLADSPKNYSNTLAFRFGGQYHATRWLTARMGMYVDESPVSSDYLNPETPSMTKLAYTAGLTFRPAKFCSLDIAYAFVNSADPERTGSTVFENPLAAANPAIPAVQSFSGNYKARAHTFSFGARFYF